MDRTVRGLRDRLADLDGKGYGAYKSIKGVYDFGDFTLSIDHVQGDPFAEPSRLRVFLPLAVCGFPKELHQNRIREVALRDYLTRSFHKAASRHSRISG